MADEGDEPPPTPEEAEEPEAQASPDDFDGEIPVEGSLGDEEISFEEDERV